MFNIKSAPLQAMRNKITVIEHFKMQLYSFITKA